MKTRLLNLIVLVCFCSFGAKAAVLNFTGATNSKWSVASNWNTGSVPTSSDAIKISADVNVDIPAFCASITINGDVTIKLNNSLVVSGGLTFSSNGTLTFNQSGTATFGGLISIDNNTEIDINSNSSLMLNGGLTINKKGILYNQGSLTIKNSTVTLLDGGASNFAYIDNDGNNAIFSAVGVVFNMGIYGTIYGDRGAITALSCTLNFNGAGSAIENTKMLTADQCTFNFLGDNTYIYNNKSTYTDHRCIYNLSGANSYIENIGSAGSMALKGSSITLSTALGATGQYIQNNNATFTADSSSTIIAATTGAAININANGVFNAGTPGSLCSITLSGSGAIINNAGTFNLGPASVIYPNTTTTPSIKNTGAFTLQSDATGSAAIGKGTTGSCTGTFNVQRYLTANRGYRLFTSPVYSSTVSSTKVYSLNYLSNTSWLSGTTGTTGGFDKPGNPTIYLYRQDVPVSNVSFTSGNFRGINSLVSAPDYKLDNETGTYNIPTGSGYLFFFRGDKALGTLSDETQATFPPTVATFTATGTLNQGNVDVKNWYGTPDLRYATTGFTLVGNPYACSIDLGTIGGTGAGIQTNNLLPFIYFFNPVSKNYITYNVSDPAASQLNASNIVASGQGFFVQADPLNPGVAASLTFTEASKIPDSQAIGAKLMMGLPQGAYDVRQLLRMKLIIDTLNYDDIAIAFNSNSSQKYNNREDSQYLAGMSAPEGLASFSADSVPVPLSINFLPLPKKAQQVIRLKVTATSSGRLTLQRTQLDQLPPIYELWLMDRYKKDSLDLRNNADYAFDVNKSDTGSYGDSRFYIVARQNKALGIHLLSFTATKQIASVPVAWTVENEQNYTNFTVERSTDNGLTFDVLGGFASNGQGVYNFTDKNPVNTVDIYRLKIEDLNGDISYSNAITIVYDPSKVVTASTKIQVFPNPAVGMVHIAIGEQGLASNGQSGVQGINYIATLPAAQKQSYGIKIVSVTGAIVKTAISSTPTWQDNVSGLLPGTYFIQVVNNSDKSLVGKSSFVKL